MTVTRAKFLLRAVAGLLVAFAAGDVRAALKIADPVGLVVFQDAVDDGLVERVGGSALWCLSDILMSYESSGSRSVRVTADGATYLVPLFPSSSGPADEAPLTAAKVVSPPLPGAGAIPGSVNGHSLSTAGFAAGGESFGFALCDWDTSLSVESRTRLPSGPRFRWFRPPKECDFSEVLSLF